MHDLESLKEPLYFTVSTAGHVDHGKTSLLKALTGIDPDRLKEEKQRQMTTDLGFAHLRISARDAKAWGAPANRELVIGFIDVPGHGKFLKNMLAGVGGLDMALLVVAADEGPMPQTVQHVKILSILGINHVLLVVTKIDVTSEARQDEVIVKSRALLERFGLKMVDAVGVSNTNKTGFDSLKQSLVRELGALDARHQEVLAAPAFLPIDRVFSKSGYGVVVTGTLVKGSIKQGDNLFIEPGSIKARVRGLETFNTQLQHAQAGQRLALNLALKENKNLTRGQAILGVDVPPTTTLIVEIAAPGNEMEENFENAVISQPARLYHGTAECSGAVRWMERRTSDDGNVKFIAQVALTDPVVADPEDRFVLRYGDEGLAGGTILMNLRSRWLTRAKLTALADMLLRNDRGDAICAYLDGSPQKLAKEQTLSCLIPPSKVEKTIESLVAAGRLVRLGEFVLTRESKDNLLKRLVSEVEKAATAGDGGGDGRGSLESIRTRLLTGLDRGAFQLLVKEAVDKGSIIRQAERLLPGSARARQTDSELEGLAKKVADLLSNNICLEIEELAKQTGSDKRKVTLAVNHLLARGDAAIVGYEFACSSAIIARAHKELARLWQSKKDISPGDFREAMGTTRKYAMAMLAYFDDQAITRRLPSGRVLLKPPK